MNIIFYALPFTQRLCSLMLATVEYVWRSGSCGSAVSIHHDSPAVGQFLIFPSLRAPTAPPLQQARLAKAICLELTAYKAHLTERRKYPSVTLIRPAIGTFTYLEECRITFFFFLAW